MTDDITLADLFSELYAALDHQSFVLASIGVRTIADRAMEILGIDPALRFDQKLDELLGQGFVGPTERDMLAILTDAGGAAAHRGWKPTEEELYALVDVVERFVYQAFILRHKVKKIGAAIPPRPKRRSS